MNSVVIVVHNIAKRSQEILSMTDTCLRTLRETADQPYQLIMIDNGSDDGNECSRLLDKYYDYKTDQVFKFTANEPVSVCWNKAIEHAVGDTIMLINNDVVFHRNGWMSMLAAPLNFDQVGATGSHKMSWNGFDFLEGSFLAFRRDRVMRIAVDGKLFDEQFEFTCEEADFCERLTRAGLTLIETGVESGGMATHLHHGTLSWTNEEGGINGVSALLVMHECRRKLCRKYGKPEQVDD